MNSTRRQKIAIGLTVGLLGVIASAVPAVLRLEETAGLDWLFLIRGPIEPPSEVAVVSIDSESADALGLPPDPDHWPRSLHATLVRQLSTAGAAAIVFDIMFDRPRDEADDQDFSAAVREAGNVVLADRMSVETLGTGSANPTLRREQRVRPIPSLARAALATAPFPLPRVPIKVSQLWVFGPSSNATGPTLPLVALLAYYRDAREALIALLQEIRPEAYASFLERRGAVGAPSLSEVGAWIRGLVQDDAGLAAELMARVASSEPPPGGELPASDRARLSTLARIFTGSDSRYLNFYGPTRSIATIPYHTIVSDDWDASSSGLAGKVVFVGFSAQLPIDQQDEFYTAFSESGASLSGVEIGATAFANFLTDTGVYPLPIPGHLLLVLLWGIGIAALLTALSTRAAFAAAIVAGTAYFGIAYLMFRSYGIWLPILVPVFAQIPAALLIVFGWQHTLARAQSEKARQTLRYYLPAQVVERLSRETAANRPSTELLHGTCLVTDAEQYTSLSERLRPEELHNLLNEYYAVLFSEVDRHGGFVSDVVGDSMVAMWASAKPDPVSQASACRAALSILSAIDEFNANHRGNELPTRVGVHAGQVLLGDIGAESHFEYRAVGDIVNAATRIQGLNKRLRTNLLVSREVLEHAPLAFSRPVGRFVLVGKSVALELHDMIGLGQPVPEPQRELGARFQAALASFHARHWDDAAESFEKLLDDWPDDGPTAFYLDLCRRYIVADPGPSWRGEVIVEEK